MSSQKIKIIAAGFLFLVCLLIVWQWFFSDDKEGAQEVPTTLPDTTGVSGVEEVSTEDEIPVFLDTATELGSDLYQVTPFTPTSTLPFDIIYNAETEMFAVALGEEPLVDSRKAAEAYLQSKLQVSIDDLCKMSVLVTVPYNVNQSYAGENLGLPSCQGSVPLE